VNRFQRTKIDNPVARNPTRASVRSGRLTDMAVDSSISSCAAASRRRPRHPRSGPTRSPYSVLREPSSSAVMADASGVPPPASTPTSANWLAPVNMTSDRTQVWATDSPEPTATAPKDVP
jgi:hypothetical protein